MLWNKTYKKSNKLNNYSVEEYRLAQQMT